MALVSPGIQISINDQSQYVNSNVGSVPLVVLATAQNKTYNGAAATGTSKANAGKLMSFTSQRDLITAMGTPAFELSSAGTPVNASERNEYGLLSAYSALGLGNRLFAIRADVDLNQLRGTSVRPAGTVADGTYWLDLANTQFGLYELNSNDTFSHISPKLITDAAQVEFDTGFGYDVAMPKQSVGQQGDYALVFVDENNATVDTIRLYYKSTNQSMPDLQNTWNEVGSDAWFYSVPAAQGTSPNPALDNTISLTINGETVSSGGSVQDLANDINSANITGVSANAIDGLLTFFVTPEATAGGVTGKLVVTDGTNTPLALCGFSSTVTAYAPGFFYGTYAQTPAGGWFSTDDKPKPAGSIWWKTTSTGGGFNPSLKKYNSNLQEWVSIIAPAYTYYDQAIAALDPVGGGINIAQGQMITVYGVIDTTYNNLNFAVQQKTGALAVTGAEVTGTIEGAFEIQATGNDFTIPPITLTGTSASSFVTDILNAGIPYVTASYNATTNAITISHTAGGVITFNETNLTPLADAGFVEGVSPYLQITQDGGRVLSNFGQITSTIHYSTETPYAAPADGTLWYYSNLADVDVMINNNGWKGYKTVSQDIRGYNLTNTDAAGVIISATTPTSQSGGGGLVAGDLWLNSSDVINYPALSRYNGASWVSIDNTDHITNNGIIFADARWDTDGTTDPVSDALPSIASLLISSNTDLDAPDYRLYPRGTLLFNTRRSGYNVKKFVSNYFNDTSFPNQQLPSKKDAWVTDSGLNEMGVMYAGAAAQRSIVVAALKSAIDSNTDVLDANYQFNLIVAPGYPELIPNMVTLNDNRGSTAFVIGDTPMTLAPTATALTDWNTNANGAGLATSSAYLGVYYPAGRTNDLAGNNVVVPSSHAVLRTFLYNDNVSYQWFAPAGVHRGLVSNLTDIGYVNAQTGAFIHNGVNQGLRDTLYTLSINPITQLPGTGLVVWGQETKSGDTTSRNRVNVVRLENYLRTIFATISNSFLFEPNDTITRKSIATQIESALHNLLSKRGLYDFLVICDTSNNTPSTIANNQLYVDVAIEPMRDVEFIYIPIALYNPGTVASLGAANT